MNITVFGLGEAGSLIACDLVKADQKVTAFDPADVPTPTGVRRVADPSMAVCEADAVFALTAGHDAMMAMRQAFDMIPRTAIYADFSTSSAERKKDLAALAATRSLPFVDVALMGIVPGHGLRTPAITSGSGSHRFVEIFSKIGMKLEHIGDTSGDAAARKLLRSVVMKGLAGLIIEAMRGAEKVDCSEWLWQNLVAEISKADEAFVRRLVLGSKAHAVRRFHEMEASTSLLQELGVEPIITQGTAESLKMLIDGPLPFLPD